MQTGKGKVYICMSGADILSVAQAPCAPTTGINDREAVDTRPRNLQREECARLVALVG